MVMAGNSCDSWRICVRVFSARCRRSAAARMCSLDRGMTSRRKEICGKMINMLNVSDQTQSVHAAAQKPVAKFSVKFKAESNTVEKVGWRVRHHRRGQGSG